MKIQAVRHEESMGNVYARAAKEQGLDRVESPVPNPQIGLSHDGMKKATQIKVALVPFTRVFASSYVRAQQTAEIAGFSHYAVDERLRDRELGCLDGFTSSGIERYAPAEAAARAHMGKFYHRPAGGESWADVVLRMRSFLFEQKMRGINDLIFFSHDVTILCALYICYDLTVDEVLAMQKESPILNGSVTEMVYQ